MVSTRAPICDRGGRCADLLEWEESRRRKTTAAPRTYSPADFLSVSDGSISCRAVSDCPTLSKEKLLFKMQLAAELRKVLRRSASRIGQVRVFLRFSVPYAIIMAPYTKQ